MRRSARASARCTTGTLSSSRINSWPPKEVAGRSRPVVRLGRLVNELITGDDNEEWIEGDGHRGAARGERSDCPGHRADDEGKCERVQAAVQAAGDRRKAPPADDG